ncbi:MAG: anti-sigma factor [Bryobacteraceae bacterium]
MHRAARDRLEEYLAGDGTRGGPEELRSHLEGCERCRREAEEMADQARLIRLLAAEEETEPAPGFYARVMDTIAARQGEGVWAMLAEPFFARRLTYAALALVIVLGSYLVYSERQGAHYAASGPAHLLAAEPLGRTYVGSNPQRDRDVVLVSLASYKE